MPIINYQGMDAHSILQADWEFRVEHKEIRIFSSRVEGSDVLGFKGEVTIPTTFRKLIALFHDTGSYLRWVHHLLEMEVLEKHDGLEYVIRQLIDAPWPVAKREMIIRTALAPFGDNGVAVTMQGAADALPENSSAVRVRDITGMWAFTPDGPDTVQLTFVMHIDPGADVPSGLSNQAMFEVPFYTLKNLRQLAADGSYNPPYPREADLHLSIV
ncbi:hypothetical protein EKD00_01535 [Chlorobium phaeovibrioides]|uniref:START domain-containing protein n=1 Tax=Chlorobium phaeovibrioides TaxID=1094 RepID=A0A432AXA7_CHLPH|nr:START domain-containing protein [Chlorobium phaeovibrioides]KAA6232635.1 hypothetical protein FP507_05760 [Chlorobium phaeovibrioides]MWV53707.1 hypothetical protein [Chlorobium phaeovibrioides]QEQ56969.1 hypothetical protein FNV82_04705 [Chlorobium phaeovibrioides]RTY37435.1 hypothetical protein EKD00_01535 [Chlorobium phaeovibrioides]RTY39929.1 hypothetical protein EKD02_00590 [Chlorobium phaeovibrioides]